MDQQQGDGRWRDALDARRLPDRLGSLLGQLLLGLARQAAHRLVVHVAGNGDMLLGERPFDFDLLAIDVAGVLG